MIAPQKIDDIADEVGEAVSKDFYKDFFAAAHVLLPHREPVEGEYPQGYFDGLTSSEIDNYKIYNELCIRLNMRPVRVKRDDMNELTSSILTQFRQRHGDVFNRLFEMEEQPQAQRMGEIIETVIRAAFLQKMAQGAAELLKSETLPACSEHRQGYLREIFGYLAQHASASYEKDGKVHLFPLAVIAKTATPYQPPANDKI